MTQRAWIDFETYSEVNLKKAGGMKYIMHGSTNPVCLGWALDDEPVELWTPRDPAPERLLKAIQNGAFVYAHNLKFDFRVWNIIMTRDFDWPALDLDQCVDSQGLCATYGLPLALDKAGEAFKIKMPKSSTGKALIKLLCTPKKGGQPLWHDPKYQAKFREMFEYCRQDIRAMRELVGMLPKEFLIEREHRIWKLTHKMNSQGLPIAYDEVIAIRERLDRYIKDTMIRVPELTDGAIEKVTQTVKIKQWINDQGYPIPNLTADTVEEALDDPKCVGKVRKILELRQELGKSSVAKFNKLIDQAYQDEDGNYWIYDNLEFHGAGPGRWSGRGFQMHNLPRFKLKDPEPWIEKFIADEYIEDPVGIAKGLIRPMIKVPDGYTLIVKDYNSIENKVLHWLAGDHETLDEFRRGVDQYKTMAASRYKVLYEEVNADQRQMGKVIILGCGFGMGWETFVDTAKSQFGMIVTEQEAREAVWAYREKYHLVKKLWNDLKVAAVRAVMTGKRQTVRHITFGLGMAKGIPWLAMKLPSGKCVYYCRPKIEARYIPKYEEMGKVPTITHMGRHPKTGQWLRIPLIPGRITENAVQGTAREVMAQGLLNVDDHMPEVKLIGTVHDEGMGIVKNSDFNETTMDRFSHHLCDIPWAKDCPITASGYYGLRYKKD